MSGLPAIETVSLAESIDIDTRVLPVNRPQPSLTTSLLKTSNQEQDNKIFGLFKVRLFSRLSSVSTLRMFV